MRPLTARVRSVPEIGPRYWAGLCLASVFGANLGDFVAHDLHLGHARGLPLLAALLLAVLAAERRAAWRTQAFYWAAIVIVRTAATNLADLASHDLRWNGAWLAGGLCLLLVLLVRRPVDGAVPRVDPLYWAGMLAAGTLGTVLGDDASGRLGVPGASLALAGLVGAMLLARAARRGGEATGYWPMVVAIRTAGTSCGDWLVDLASLAPATAASGGAFVLLLAGWRERTAGLPSQPESA